MSMHNLCFKKKYEKISDFFFSEFFLLEVKFSLYLNRHILYCLFLRDKALMIKKNLLVYCALDIFQKVGFVYMVL